MFGDQTPSTIVLRTNILLFGHLLWCCLIVLNCVRSCLIEFEGHKTFDQRLKLFLLFLCLMGDVLFVWTAPYQTCLMQTCVPRLLSGLYQLFDLYLIKTCFNRLSTHFKISMFGHQTFLVCPGCKTSTRFRKKVPFGIWQQAEFTSSCSKYSSPVSTEQYFGNSAMIIKLYI